jgi:hypothetical protein
MEKKVREIVTRVSRETGLVSSWKNLGSIANDYDQFVVTLRTQNNLLVGYFNLQTMKGKYLAYFFNEDTTFSPELEKWIINVVGYYTHDGVEFEPSTKNSLDFIKVMNHENK